MARIFQKVGDGHRNRRRDRMFSCRLRRLPLSNYTENEQVSANDIQQYIQMANSESTRALENIFTLFQTMPKHAINIIERIMQSNLLTNMISMIHTNTNQKIILNILCHMTYSGTKLHINNIHEYKIIDALFHVICQSNQLDIIDKAIVCCGNIVAHSEDPCYIKICNKIIENLCNIDNAKIIGTGIWCIGNICDSDIMKINDIEHILPHLLKLLDNVSSNIVNGTDLLILLHSIQTTHPTINDAFVKHGFIDKIFQILQTCNQNYRKEMKHSLILALQIITVARNSYDMNIIEQYFQIVFKMVTKNSKHLNHVLWSISKMIGFPVVLKYALSDKLFVKSIINASYQRYGVKLESLNCLEIISEGCDDNEKEMLVQMGIINALTEIFNPMRTFKLKNKTINKCLETLQLYLPKYRKFVEESSFEKYLDKIMSNETLEIDLFNKLDKFVKNNLTLDQFEIQTIAPKIDHGTNQFKFVVKPKIYEYIF